MKQISASRLLASTGAQYICIRSHPNSIGISSRSHHSADTTANIEKCKYLVEKDKNSCYLLLVVNGQSGRMPSSDHIVPATLPETITFIFSPQYLHIFFIFTMLDHFYLFSFTLFFFCSQNLPNFRLRGFLHSSLLLMLVRITWTL